MEIVGSPVGSADFCSSFVAKTINKMIDQSQSLLQLHPQCATKLIRECVCPAPAYLAQVCHPRLTRDHLLRFDNAVWDMWRRILGADAGDDLTSCETALTRARMRAFLPSYMDGVGFRCWEKTGSFAWFCSMASCIALHDPDFEFARRFPTEQNREAYELALAAIGGPSYLEDSKIELLPIGEPDVLSNPEFFSLLFRDNPKIKLQRIFQQLAGVSQRKSFLAYGLSHADESQKVILQALQNAEPGTSILSKMFTAKLTQRATRLED
jgi:hypothetical protein